MSARLLLRERTQLAEDRFVSIVVWEVPMTVAGSGHFFKYSLALVVDDVCVLRYDNEAGKGDHKHVGDRESAYAFTSIEVLLADFRHDVMNWRSS